jgi:hypothetical protein
MSYVVWNVILCKVASGVKGLSQENAASLKTTGRFGRKQRFSERGDIGRLVLGSARLPEPAGDAFTYSRLNPSARCQ